MTSSKDMRPTAPFFPNIFFKNQFCSTPEWPSSELNLVGKTALVTGANQGLGYEASHQLLGLGLSRLILAVRSLEKGETAAQTLRNEFPEADINVSMLDMSSYDSIQKFVGSLAAKGQVDIAILNAGLRKTKFDLVPSTSHEESIQINYLSTVLLCVLLLPIMKARPGHEAGRISIVSSGLAFAARFPNRMVSPLLPSFDHQSEFESMDRYNTSKLLGMFFIRKLTEYISADDIVVNLVDPGFVKGTDLSRGVSAIAMTFMNAWKKIAARSLRVGASTYIDAAVLKGRESHGSFLMSWEISP